MGDQRAYVRVYWTIIDDPKFADVYDDDSALATWLRLLIAADSSWPASAALPVSAKRAPLATLVRVGLVDLVHGSRYRIHGLDSERNARASSARNAAAMRWQSDRNATASGVQMPSRAEPSKAEPSRADAGARDGLHNVTPTVDTAWTEATGRGILGSGAFASEYIDDAGRRHPEASVLGAIAAARATFTVIPTPQQLAVKVRSILDPLTPPVTEVAAEHEAQAAADWERKVASTKRRTHEFGGHEAEADPRCPMCQGEGVTA